MGCILQVQVRLQLVQVALVHAKLFEIHTVRQLGTRAAQPQPHAERRLRRQRAPPIMRGMQTAQQVGGENATGLFGFS